MACCTYNDKDRQVLVKEAGGSAPIVVTSQALGAEALPIYGGTDQIQRNIISERTLGLPKEPGRSDHPAVLGARRRTPERAQLSP